MKILIIVESPAKANKIQSFLGNNYIVKSCKGHIRDLGKDNMGIDVNNNFNPNYIITKFKEVNDLINSQKFCKEVILASDLDREGEAIAWHLAEVLKLKNPKRIVFNNISKKSILDALNNPKNIDMNLVHAQQARQILDKLIGFELSPLLWDHVVDALSAGRVQSVTTKLVIERENEIEKFESKSYYKTIGLFDNNLEGELNKNFENNIDVLSFLEKCKNCSFTIGNTSIKNFNKFPSAPFRTSTLQQEAVRKLNMTVKSVMNNAQILYENGYITYHRTDSVDISSDALNIIKKYILEKYGQKFLNIRKYKTTIKSSQEAHECIRPINLNLDNLNDTNLTPQQKKLYELIWKKTISSQMAPSDIESYTLKIIISNSDEYFICKAEKIIFLGFKIIYDYKDIDIDNDNDNDNDNKKSNKNLNIILSCKEGTNINYQKIISSEKFTKPINRFTEGTIAKKMEELGFGRPATTASMITKIQDRKYVIKETRKGRKVPYKIYTLYLNNIINTNGEITLDGDKNKLFPTKLGKEVTEFLIKYFPDIMDYKFTSKIEEEFDQIANGNKIWYNVVKSVYDNYHPVVEKLKNNKTKITSNNNMKRFVGKHHITGKNIYAYVAKFGPVLQIGDDKNDISFIPIKEGYDHQTINENEANLLLKYPKNLGIFDNKIIYLKEGKFGLYLSHDNKNYGFNDDFIDKENCTLEQAIDIINNKNNKNIKIFNNNTRILNGPYGPYILHNKKIIPLPKEIENPQNLTLKDIKEIINQYSKSKKKLPPQKN
jgi:DNA topoisomerase-1